MNEPTTINLSEPILDPSNYQAIVIPKGHSPELYKAAPDLLVALLVAQKYVAATHNSLMGATGPNTVVKPDLDLINSALIKAGIQIP